MIYFTSDPHFYHSNIIKYCNRPYSSVEEMNEALVTNWNSIVKPEDTVYCLGDFSLAIRPVELYSAQLNGTKYLVPGNHDWCHPTHSKARGAGLAKWIDFYTQHGWIVLPIQTELTIEGVGVVNLCHLPYKGDSTDARYAEYRLVDDGKWLICGHVHEKWKVKGKMINVGVDVWDLHPVSIEEIKALIS